MSLFEFAVLLLIAAVCGAAGQSLAGSSRGGCLAAIAVGFVGALLGSWLARLLELPPIFVVHLDDVDFPVVWSILGSTLFVALLSLLTRSTRPAPRA